MPIYSVCSGGKRIGWNELGGWRIGIRGSDNIYYYYAHLILIMIISRYQDKRPNVAVGNTGYGPEVPVIRLGSLHFGMYENNIAINPYPFLRAWEGREFSPLKSK